MFYLKHHYLGNKHVETEAEADKLVPEGWVRWPRSKEQKQVDPVAVAAAARQKYEDEQTELARLRAEQGKGKKPSDI